MYPDDRIAIDCSENEYRLAKLDEQRNQEIETWIGIEKMKLACDPTQWVFDNVADPSMELEILLKQIALYYNDPCQIGHICKTIVTNRLRVVAESKL